MLVLNLKSADKRYKQRGGNPRLISRSCIATSQLMLMNFPLQAIAILLFFKGIAIARRTLRGMRPEQNTFGSRSTHRQLCISTPLVAYGRRPVVCRLD